MQKFKVKWDHIGDRAYKAGDVREANPNAVKHLVKSGILEPMDGKAQKKPATKKTATKKPKLDPSQSKKTATAKPPKKKAMPVEKNKAMPASDKNKAAPVQPLTNERAAAPKAKRKGFFGKKKA